MGRSRSILYGAVGLAASLAGCAGTNQSLVDKGSVGERSFPGTRLASGWRTRSSADAPAWSTARPVAEMASATSPAPAPAQAGESAGASAADAYANTAPAAASPNSALAATNQTPAGLNRYFPMLNRQGGTASRREDMLRPATNDLWAEATREKMRERVARARQIEADRERSLAESAAPAAESAEPVLPVALQVGPASDLPEGRPRVDAVPRVRMNPNPRPAAPADDLGVPDGFKPSASLGRTRGPLSSPEVVPAGATLEEPAVAMRSPAVERVSARDLAEPDRTPTHGRPITPPLPSPSPEPAPSELLMPTSPDALSQPTEAPIPAIRHTRVLSAEPVVTPLETAAQNAPAPPTPAPLPVPAPPQAPTGDAPEPPAPSPRVNAPEPPAAPEPPMLPVAPEPNTAKPKAPAPKVEEPPVPAPAPAPAPVPAPAAPETTPPPPSEPPAPEPPAPKPAPAPAPEPAPAPAPEVKEAPRPSAEPPASRQAIPASPAAQLPAAQAPELAPQTAASTPQETAYVTPQRYAPAGSYPRVIPVPPLSKVVKPLASSQSMVKECRFEKINAAKTWWSNKWENCWLVNWCKEKKGHAAGGVTASPQGQPAPAKRAVVKPSAQAPRPAPEPVVKPTPQAPKKASPQTVPGWKTHADRNPSSQLPPGYAYPVAYYGGVTSPGATLANPQRPEPTVPAYSYWSAPTDPASVAASHAPKHSGLFARLKERFTGSGHCDQQGCRCNCHGALATPQAPAPASAAPSGQSAAR
ncbi:MAG: hypothetical protein U0835_03345 [Isosphaeraceae bacterium]